MTLPATLVSLSASAQELADVSRELEGMLPADIVRWAIASFGDADEVPPYKSFLVTSSFQDATLSHVAHSAAPGIEVVLLDTGYLFAETHWYAENLGKTFGINVHIDKRNEAHLAPNGWQVDTDACCAARKVVPLEDALQNKKVWITGVRREDSEARKNTPIVSRDIMRGVIKVNPLAGTSDSDLALYNELYELPVHPLRQHGYTSIGCWPCTRPTKPGEDPRAGRWSGSGKTECGLHIS